MTAPEPPPSDRPHQAHTIQERVELLFDELSLAIRWDRPSMLLAVYQSEHVNVYTQRLLADLLHEVGMEVETYRVTKDNFDIPLALTGNPERTKKVFFISGLKWGGGRGSHNAFRALNMRREYFVDRSIRSVFWLTKNEAALMPRRAPDFWAFRHRVIDFTEIPAEGFHTTTEFVSPQNIEASTAELNRTVAKMLSHRNDGQYALALESSLQAIELLPHSAANWNNLGGVYYELGCLELAEKALKKAVSLDKIGPEARYNLGLVYDAAERPSQAVRSLRKATRLAPEFAPSLNELGRIYLRTGNMRAARQVLKRSLDLNKDDTNSRLLLAHTYFSIGKSAQGRKEMNRAESRLEGQDDFLQAAYESLNGDSDRAIERLEAGLINKQFSIQQVWKDPRFAPLLADPKFTQLRPAEPEWFLTV